MARNVPPPFPPSYTPVSSDAHTTAERLAYTDRAARTTAERAAYQDDQVGDLRSAISLVSANLRDVSEELARERETRQKEKERGVSVLSLHVPFGLLLLLVGALVPVGIAGGMFINSTRAHIADTKSHVDADKALARGGLAYTTDVTSAIDGRASAIEASDRAALRILVRTSPLKCKARAGWGGGSAEGTERGHYSDCVFGDAVTRQ